MIDFVLKSLVCCGEKLFGGVGIPMSETINYSVMRVA